jgi:integrase/recombinase XerD
MRRPLTVAEADALWHAAQKPVEKLVLALGLDCGLRVSEMAQLRDLDVDWHARPPRARVYAKGRERVVPLSPRAAALASAWLAVNVMPSARSIQRTVQRLARKAGLRRPVSPHVLRHTFAVQALERGLSLPALRALLGHSRLETTARYLGMSNVEAIREWQAKLGAEQ